MFTATIANVAVSIFKDSLSEADKINEQTDCSFTVIDLTGTRSFTKNLPVEIIDDTRGTRFAGFINNQPTATLIYPNPARLWAIDAKDQTWLMQKRSANKTYKGQYAGTILVDMVQRYGSIEGLFCHAALGWYELLTEWQQGTASGVIPTTNAGDGNVGDGDLELALAGAPWSFSQVSQADFSGSAGGLTSPATGGVSFTPTQAIRYQATENVPGLANAFSYVKIWEGPYTIASGDYLTYDVWIASTSPQQMAAIDLVLSTGTAFRDSQAVVNVDAQGIGPHAKNDLSGLATNQWYNRQFTLSGITGSWVGKTISYVSAAFEGESQGIYTAYFRNVAIMNGGTTKVSIFGPNDDAPAIVPQQLQNSGYSAMSCIAVTTHERHGYMYAGGYYIGGAGIAKSSYVSWDIGMPTVLTSSFTFTVTASIDAFSTFLPCVNNGPIPGLLPGMNLAGKSVYFVYVFDNAGPDPTLTPLLHRVSAAISPAYACSKSDVVSTTNLTTGWSGGTLTNLINTGGNSLQLNGYARNWNDANYGSQTLFGTGGINQGMLSQQFFIKLTGAGQGNSRLDFVGNWQDFTLEVDVKIETNGKPGVAYRTTGWSNADANYAYAVEITLAGIFLQRGSNSSSSSPGTRTQIGSAAFTLNSGDTHRLKLIIAGSEHQIYLDDVLYLDIIDSTYGSAGGVSLRSAPTAAYTQTYNNFGIVQALSGTWVSPVIDLSSLVTISNAELLLQIDPGVNTTICTFLAEISLNNGATWTSLVNVATTLGYYQALPVAGLTPGTNVSSLTQVRIRLTIAATTAATGSAMPDLTAVTLSVLGAYNSTGTWSTIPLAWDSAQRANVSGSFGVATNGATYSKTGTGATNLNSNALQIGATTGDVHMRIGSATATDQGATVRVQLAGSVVAYLELRYSNSSNYYRLAASTTALAIYKNTGGGNVLLASTPITLSTGSWYHLHFAAVGSGPVTLLGRAWPDDIIEPNTWTTTASD